MGNIAYESRLWLKKPEDLDDEKNYCACANFIIGKMYPVHCNTKFNVVCHIPKV